MTEHQQEKKRKNPWRFAFAALAVLSSLELLGYLAAWLIADVFGGISFALPSSAVGIIGGADGPTSIFVAATAEPDWQLVLWILLLAVGIWGYLRLSRHKQK